MIARKKGAIVNMSSLAAWNGGGPGAGAYSTAKGAVVSLTKALAKELAPHGIRVNCVAPGLIGETAFHGRFTAPAAFENAAKGVLLGRAGTPDEVATVVAFLASPDCVVPDRRDDRDQRRHEHAMKITGLRWLMIGLVFLATVINYIDRQTVSVLKTSISQDLGLSNADYAAIQNSFLLFYGISQMVSGRLYDVIGTRLGFVFSIVVWSLAALAHATARTATASASGAPCSDSAKPATGPAPPRWSASGFRSANARWAWASSTPARPSAARCRRRSSPGWPPCMAGG